MPVYLLNPKRLGVAPGLFLPLKSYTLKLKIQSRVERVDVLKNVPLASCFVQLFVALVLACASNDGVHQIPPFTNHLQRELELFFVWTLLDRVCQDAKFLVEIRLLFNSLIDFGHKRRLLLPLEFTCFQFQCLQEGIVRVLA